MRLSFIYYNFFCHTGVFGRESIKNAQLIFGSVNMSKDYYFFNKCGRFKVRCKMPRLSRFNSYNAIFPGIIQNSANR